MTEAGRASAPVEASQESQSSSVTQAVTQNVQQDQEILLALDSGDRRRALALCVQIHGLSIGRLCMAMLASQTDADDVVQDTLLAAHQAFGEFRRDGTLRAWLLGIARNKCLQYLEKRRRRGARLRLVSAMGAATEAGAELDLLARGRAEQARSLLERVRPSDRDALLLRYCGELSFKEVAAACGIEEATARKRVSRALLALRSTLGKEADHD